MTAMLERWKCEEGYEIQLVLAHTVVKIRMNERTGYNRGNVEVKSMPDMAKVTDLVMTGAG